MGLSTKQDRAAAIARHPASSADDEAASSWRQKHRNQLSEGGGRHKRSWNANEAIKAPPHHPSPCVVKRRSAAGLRCSKAEREAVLRGHKVKRSGAPNSLPGRLTCTHPGGCLPGFALRSLRLSPLFFFFTHSTSNLFIYLSFRLQSNISSQDLIGSTGTGHTRSSLQQAYVCVSVCVKVLRRCPILLPRPPHHQPPTARKREQRG